MPIYEFECSFCQNAIELLLKANEDPPIVCPKCKKERTLQKLISNSSFHLKGGGWYKDLYASAKPKSEDSPKASTSEKSTAKKEE